MFSSRATLTWDTLLVPGTEPVPGYSLVRPLGEGAYGRVWMATTPGDSAHTALKFVDLSQRHGWKEYRGIRNVMRNTKIKGNHLHLAEIYGLWMLDEYGEVMDDTTLSSVGESSNTPLNETLKAPPQETPRENLRFTISQVEQQRSGAPRRDQNNRRPRFLVIAQRMGDKTLADRLNETEGNGIPLLELLDYIKDAADAIDHLNSRMLADGTECQPVQHCDIKPANLLILGKKVLLCDYGVAQSLELDDVDVRATSTSPGSLAYISPECLIKRKPGDRSDQYSLAITYFELRTGCLPYRGLNPGVVQQSIIEGTLDFSRVTPAEREVLKKATSLDPADRYNSAMEMVRHLEIETSDGPALEPWKRRREIAFTLTGVTLVALAVAVLLLNIGPKGSNLDEILALAQSKPTDEATDDFLDDARPLAKDDNDHQKIADAWLTYLTNCDLRDAEWDESVDLRWETYPSYQPATVLQLRNESLSRQFQDLDNLSDANTAVNSVVNRVGKTDNDPLRFWAYRVFLWKLAHAKTGTTASLEDNQFDKWQLFVERDAESNSKFHNNRAAAIVLQLATWIRQSGPDDATRRGRLLKSIDDLYQARQYLERMNSMNDESDQWVSYASVEQKIIREIATWYDDHRNDLDQSSREKLFQLLGAEIQVRRYLEDMRQELDENRLNTAYFSLKKAKESLEVLPGNATRESVRNNVAAHELWLLLRMPDRRLTDWLGVLRRLPNGCLRKWEYREQLELAISDRWSTLMGQTAIPEWDVLRDFCDASQQAGLELPMLIAAELEATIQRQLPNGWLEESNSLGDWAVCDRFDPLNKSAISKVMQIADTRHDRTTALAGDPMYFDYVIALANVTMAPQELVRAEEFALDAIRAITSETPVPAHQRRFFSRLLEARLAAIVLPQQGLPNSLRDSQRDRAARIERSLQVLDEGSVSRMSLARAILALSSDELTTQQRLVGVANAALDDASSRLANCGLPESQINMLWHYVRAMAVRNLDTRDAELIAAGLTSAVNVVNAVSKLSAAAESDGDRPEEVAIAKRDLRLDGFIKTALDVAARRPSDALPPPALVSKGRLLTLRAKLAERSFFVREQLGQDRYKTIYQWYREAGKADPDSLDHIVGQGEAYSRWRRNDPPEKVYGELVRLAKAARQIDESSASFHNLKGLACLWYARAATDRSEDQRRLLRKADEAFSKAIAANRDEFLYYTNRSTARVELAFAIPKDYGVGWKEAQELLWNATQDAETAVRASTNRTVVQRVQAHLALGNANEDLAFYLDQFGHFTKANAAFHEAYLIASQNFDHEQMVAAVVCLARCNARQARKATEPAAQRKAIRYGMNALKSAKPRESLPAQLKVEYYFWSAMHHWWNYNMNASDQRDSQQSKELARNHLLNTIRLAKSSDVKPEYIAQYLRQYAAFETSVLGDWSKGYQRVLASLTYPQAEDVIDAAVDQALHYQFKRDTAGSDQQPLEFGGISEQVTRLRTILEQLRHEDAPSTVLAHLKLRCMFLEMRLLQLRLEDFEADRKANIDRFLTEIDEQTLKRIVTQSSSNVQRSKAYLILTELARHKHSSNRTRRRQLHRQAIELLYPYYENAVQRSEVKDWQPTAMQQQECENYVAALLLYWKYLKADITEGDSQGEKEREYVLNALTYVREHSTLLRQSDAKRVLNAISEIR